MAVLDSNDQVGVMSSWSVDKWEVSILSPSSILVCYVSFSPCRDVRLSMTDRKHDKIWTNPSSAAASCYQYIISLLLSGHSAFKLSVGLFGHQQSVDCFTHNLETYWTPGYRGLMVNTAVSGYGGDFSYDVTTIITVGPRLPIPSTSTQTQGSCHQIFLNPWSSVDTNVSRVSKLFSI